MVFEVKERNFNKNNYTPLQIARNPPPSFFDMLFGMFERSMSKSEKMEELLISRGAKY